MARRRAWARRDRLRVTAAGPDSLSFVIATMDAEDLNRINQLLDHDVELREVN